MLVVLALASPPNEQRKAVRRDHIAPAALRSKSPCLGTAASVGATNPSGTFSTPSVALAKLSLAKERHKEAL